MQIPDQYIKFICLCDKFLHRQQYKEVCQVLSQVKQIIEEEEQTDVDNDFNSRAALCALLFGQSEEALKLTEMVNLNSPGFLLIQTLRGWALKEIGYEKRANVLFNYVINSFPETDSVMDSFGAALGSKLSGNEQSQLFFDWVITKFEELTGDERKLNQLWYVHALIRKAELIEDIGEKQQILLKAVELTQESVVVYYSLGDTYFHQKQYELSLKCYLKSIEINPMYTYYRHMKVSFIYFFTGREEEAKRFLSHFVHQSKDIQQFLWVLSHSIEIRKSAILSDFEKYYKIGIYLYYIQAYQSSLIMLQKAMEYDKYNYKLCMFMRNVHTYLGQPRQAIQLFEDFQQHANHAHDIPLIIILAQLYTSTSQNDKAEQLYLKLIDLTPNQTFSLYIYVKFLNKDNRLEDSLTQIKKAIEIDPKKIKLLIMKALIHSSLKQLPQAYETYEEVLQINPHLQSTRYQLSQINYVLNNYQKSFSQMMNIKEGEVGYEKSINLLIKLYISHPQHLTSEQLHFANTNLRSKLSHHLKTLGDIPKKKKIFKKNNNNNNNGNKDKKDIQNKQDNKISIESDKAEDISKSNKMQGIMHAKTNKSAQKIIKQESNQQEVNQSDNQQGEEEIKFQHQDPKQDDQEIKEEQEQERQEEEEEIKENNNKNENINNNGNNQNMNDEEMQILYEADQEEIEINKLLEGQGIDSMDELDEIDMEINDQVLKQEDTYKQYLQKIREENKKDKYQIYKEHSAYYDSHQNEYKKMINQAKKNDISSLFQNNDINLLLLGDKLNLKNQDDEKEEEEEKEENQGEANEKEDDEEEEEEIIEEEDDEIENIIYIKENEQIDEEEEQKEQQIDNESDLEDQDNEEIEQESEDETGRKKIKQVRGRGRNKVKAQKKQVQKKVLSRSSSATNLKKLTLLKKQIQKKDKKQPISKVQNRRKKQELVNAKKTLKVKQNDTNAKLTTSKADKQSQKQPVKKVQQPKKQMTKKKEKVESQTLSQKLNLKDNSKFKKDIPKDKIKSKKEINQQRNSIQKVSKKDISSIAQSKQLKTKRNNLKKQQTLKKVKQNESRPKSNKLLSQRQKNKIQIDKAESIKKDKSRSKSKQQIKTSKQSELESKSQIQQHKNKKNEQTTQNKQKKINIVKKSIKKIQKQGTEMQNKRILRSKKTKILRKQNK